MANHHIQLDMANERISQIHSHAQTIRQANEATQGETSAGIVASLKRVFTGKTQPSLPESPLQGQEFAQAQLNNG